MICYKQRSLQFPITTVCPGEKNCYKKQWSGHRGTIIERGCGCPSVKKGIEINCCTTDKCNR
uniref:Short neurotoxin 4 n=1 Tax=Naja annulifera TaxID=96794 RepID=3S14_NAJHA|nr:RecName: Full=Short neurotoxin 4; AltName: Full=Toxin CM-12; AltName: Full=Toxin V-NH-I2 [Naja annulifera]prf//751415B toxin CM12 [Naja annulifera]